MGKESPNVVVTAPPGSAESSQPPSEQTLELSSKEEVEADRAVKRTSEKVGDEAVLPVGQETGQPEDSVERTEGEEKAVGSVEESTHSVVAAGRQLLPRTAEEPIASFKEESYDVKDLKESEKKALQDLKVKIEESINNNTILTPAKPETPSTKLKVKKKRAKKKAGKKEAEAKAVKGEAEGKDKETAEATRGAVFSTEDAEPEAEAEPPLPLSVEPTEESVEEVEEEAAFADETEVALTEAPTKAAGDDPSKEVHGEKTNRDVMIEEHDSSSLQDLSLWGVPILPSKGDERLDVILLKFLRAREFRRNDAFSMLQKTMLWRKDFNADTLIDEEIANTEFDSVAYMHGYDKQGHPVCYNQFGIFQEKELYQKTFEDEAGFKRFLRWRIQVLEKGIRQLDFKPGGANSMVQVTDLKDSPGLVKRINISKKVVSLLKNNYPELVAKQIFVNVPWYFGALYSLHGFALTRRSKSKVVLVRPQKVTETLFKYISPEYVPLQYGGLSRPDNSEFEGIEAQVKEVIVKASEKQTIELPVEESGSRVIWEEFVPSGEGKYTVIIQKSKKVAACDETMRNSFKATEPGKVVLTIDNTTTKKRRLAVYRYVLKEVAASAT